MTVGTGQGAGVLPEPPIPARAFVLGGMSVIGFAFIIATNRYAVGTLGVEPLVFSTHSMLFGGLILLVLGGGRPTAFNGLRSPYSWGYGIFRIIELTLYLFALLAITGTEAELIAISRTAFMAIATWLLFRARAPTREWPGLLMIVAGSGMVAARLEADVPWWALGSIFMTFPIILIFSRFAELHPVGGEAKTLVDQAGYVGAVLMVTAIVFLVALMILAGLQDAAGRPLYGPLSASVPSVGAFFDPDALVTGLTLGALPRTFAMFGSLIAIRDMKMTNYMALLAVTPFFAFLIESVYAAFGLVDLAAVDGWDAVGGAITISGSMLTLYLRTR